VLLLLNMMLLRLIRVVVCIQSLSLFSSRLVFHCVDILRVFLSPMDGIWIVSSFWWLCIKLPETFTWRSLSGHTIFISLNKYSGVGLLGHVSASSTLSEAGKLLSRMAIPLCIPISSKWEFQSLASLSVRGFVGDLDFSCFNRCAGLLHGGFNLQVVVSLSLMASDVEHLFLCLYAIHYLLFGRVSI